LNISVILSTCNRPDILSRTLNSLLYLKTEKLVWELLIVDNADDIDTQEVVKSYRHRLPLRFFVQRKPGKNHALNLVLPLAKGDLFVFTDDDIIADKNWLIHMWQGAGRWRANDVFGGKILAAWPDNQSPCWGNHHPLNQSIFGLHDPFPTEKLYDSGPFLPYGPNLAIRKKIFDQGYTYNTEIGPDNKTVYRMGSETELLARLKKNGFLSVYLPDSIVYHQIRPFQLTSKGLAYRNFRIGYSSVTPNDYFGTLIGGCSRYLWRQLIETLWQLYRAKLNRNTTAEFEAQAHFYRIRGKIYAQRHCSGISPDSCLQKVLDCN